MLPFRIVMSFIQPIRLLDIQNVDYAEIHDIYYKDIRVECDGDNPTPAIQTAEEQSYRDKPGMGTCRF